jgi:hypothetical protein
MRFALRLQLCLYGFVKGHHATSYEKTRFKGFVTGHDFSRANEVPSVGRALAPARRSPLTAIAGLLFLAMAFCLPAAQAQKPTWREATEAELQALLPARAPVEKEHIETESSTASGITDGKGHFIAGIVLITAGYSADGKYSHYLIVQSPMAIDGIHLTPGEYVFGYSRDGDSLTVRLYEALTGKPVGTAKATRIPGTTMVKSLRILPPSEKPFIQIGRFGIPYELADK